MTSRRLVTLALLAALLAGCKTPISDEMTAIGFTPNPAPEDNLIIGTVYQATRDSSGNLIGLVQLCNPALIDSTLVKPNVNYISHNTTETQKVTSTSTSNNLVIDASKLKAINASLSASGKTVNQVNIVIKDAKILDTDKTNLDTIAIAMAAKNPLCKDNITNAGKNAEGVMREFVATVTYSVDTSANENFNTDITLQNALKATLGAEWDTQSQTFVSGSQLAYGYVLLPVDISTRISSLR